MPGTLGSGSGDWRNCPLNARLPGPATAAEVRVVRHSQPSR